MLYFVDKSERDKTFQWLIDNDKKGWKKSKELTTTFQEAIKEIIELVDSEDDSDSSC